MGAAGAAGDGTFRKRACGKQRKSLAVHNLQCFVSSRAGMLILTGQILVLLGRWAGKAGVRKTRMAYHTNQSVAVILHAN